MSDTRKEALDQLELQLADLLGDMKAARLAGLGEIPALAGRAAALRDALDAAREAGDAPSTLRLQRDTTVWLDGHALTIGELGVQAVATPTPNPGHEYTAELAELDVQRVAEALGGPETAHEQRGRAAQLLSRVHGWKLGAPPESPGHQYARGVFEAEQEAPATPAKCGAETGRDDWGWRCERPAAHAGDHEAGGVAWGADGVQYDAYDHAAALTDLALVAERAGPHAGLSDAEACGVLFGIADRALAELRRVTGLGNEELARRVGAARRAVTPPRPRRDIAHADAFPVVLDGAYVSAGTDEHSGLAGIRLDGLSAWGAQVPDQHYLLDNDTAEQVAAALLAASGRARANGWGTMRAMPDSPHDAAFRAELEAEIQQRKYRATMDALQAQYGAVPSGQRADEERET